MMRGMKHLLLLALVHLLIAGGASAAIKVVSLHPLLGDVAGQVGGDGVEVINLMSEKDDPHHFTLRTTDLRKAEGADLFVASGKGLEGFLPKLKQNLPAGAKLLVAGDWVPTLKSAEVCNHDHGDEHGHDHGHNHGHGHEVDDPHWWHSIGHMRRVALRLGSEFAKADPENAAAYRKNAANYAKELGELEAWAKLELSKVPKGQRVLATSHAAFGYFCDAFDFEALPVQGLTADIAPTAQGLRELTEQLKAKQVGAVFPEAGINPKTLAALGKAAGIKIGGQLNGDGMANNYKEFFKSNVDTIVAALVK